MFFAICALGFAPGASAQVLLGDQTIEPSQDSNTVGQAEAFQTTAALTGSIGSITVFVDASSASSALFLGLYSDNAGHPGTLLTLGSINAPQTGAWNTIGVTTTSVTAGTRYWFAILGTSGGRPAFRDRSSGSCASETSSQTGLQQLPATWGTAAVYTDCPLSAYGSAPTANSPTLSVTPATVAFTASPGGENPTPATVNVKNTGGGTLSFTAASDSPWLTVTPSSGTAPASLQVSASAAGLALGVHTGHVTVTASGAQGSPAVVQVSLTIAKASDWLMVDHDPARTGNAVDETTITTGNVGTLQLSWSFNVDGPVTGQPLLVVGLSIAGQLHDVLYAATGGNSIYALDAATGSTLWRRNFGAPPNNCAIPGGFGITGAPLIDRNANRLYTVSDDGVFHTLSLTDGTDAAPALTLIASPLTNKVWGGLNRVGSFVYVATASDGCDSRPWRGQTFRVNVATNPALSGSFTIVPGIASPSGGGGIWGYGGISADAATGNIYGASGSDSNNPEGYTPYANRMIAWDASLNLLGSFGPPEPANFPCAGDPCDLDFGSTPVVFQPAGCPTMVAAGNKNGNLYVFKATDLAASAAPFQILPLNAANDWLGSGGVGGVPAYWAAGNMLFVVTAGSGITGVSGGVIGLNVTSSCTLQVAWSKALGGATQPNSTPTIANGIVFAGEGATGFIHAYDARTGTPLWTSTSQYGAAATYAAPIVAQGHVYAGSWSNFSGGGIVGAFSLSGQTPVLSVSPLSLSFSAIVGGANPAAKTATISNPGVGTLNFTASSDSPWLTVSPTNGAAPQTLQISSNITGLGAGTYTGHITVVAAGAQGSPATITATLTITTPPPPQPVLSVSPTTLSMSGTAGGSNPPSATVNVTNTGTGTLNFNTASDSAWLTVSPTSGTAPQALQVSTNIAGLAANTYTGHVTITSAGATNSPSTVTVTLTIIPAGSVLLGDQTIEPQVDSNAMGRAEMFQTAGLATGSLTSLTFYLDASSTAGKVYVGLYSNNNGHPGTLLTQGTPTQLTKGAWNTVTVPAVSITSGATYWIGILGTTSGQVAFRDRANGSCKSETSSQQNLTTFPATWTTGTAYTDCPISSYGR